MYREHGWLPKWELYGRETLTMEGDPSIPVIVDTWLKGLRDFDIDLAYEAMYKSATLPGAENLLRPDNDDYMSLGYVPLREQYDNSVSHALEYYIADYSLSLLADALGKRAAEQGKKAEARKYQADARLFITVHWDINTTIVRNLVLSVPFCLTVSSIHLSIRDRERILNRIPVFMKDVPGITVSMFPTM